MLFIDYWYNKQNFMVPRISLYRVSPVITCISESERGIHEDYCDLKMHEFAYVGLRVCVCVCKSGNVVALGYIIDRRLR